MHLNLKLHPYAVLQNGERTAFFSNLELAAQRVRDSIAGGVIHLWTKQEWGRAQCQQIAGEQTYMSRSAAA